MNNWIAYLRHRISRDPLRLCLELVFKGTMAGVCVYLGSTAYKLHAFVLGEAAAQHAIKVAIVAGALTGTIAALLALTITPEDK